MVFLSPPGVPLLGLAMLKSVFYTYSHVLKIISLEAQLHTSLSLGDIQFSFTSVCFGTGCNCVKSSKRASIDDVLYVSD